MNTKTLVDYPNFEATSTLCLVTEGYAAYRIRSLEYSYYTPDFVDFLIKSDEVEFPKATIAIKYVTEVRCINCGQDHDNDFDTPCWGVKQ